MCKESIKVFVCEEHIPAIEEFCKTNHCCISFRRAGAETVDRMRKGHPCKGHDVLEKSIKPSRKDVFEDGTALTSDDYKLLGGLIGHRSTKETTKGRLKGVYVSDKAFEECESKAANDPDAGFWEEVKRVKLKNAAKGNKRKWIDLTDGVKKFLAGGSEKVAPYFLTGDYDIHDFFKMEAGKLYPCGHANHMALLQELNKHLIEKGTASPGLNRSTIIGDGNLENEFSFIRHGGQINYCLYMALMESNVQRVYNVVVADYDVAFCDNNGTWTVCDPSGNDKVAAKTAYNRWYTDHHVELKVTFNPENVGKIWEQMKRGLPAKTLLTLASMFLYKDDGTGTGKNSLGLSFFNQLRSYFSLERTIMTVEAFKKAFSEEKTKALFDYLTEVKANDVELTNLIVAADKYINYYLGNHPNEVDVLAQL